MNIFQLKRNDIRGALKFRMEAIETGKWNSDLASMLAKLQDDPTQLYTAIRTQDASLEKALPKEQQDAPIESKPIGAASKTLGSGGQVRYNYVNEKGGGKKRGGAKASAPKEIGGVGSAEEDKELPHPDLAAPNPDQAPIAAELPKDPDVQDGRAQDVTQSKAPKHTMNVTELCSALGIGRDVLQQTVAKIQAKFGKQARSKYIDFMSIHLKDFAQSHGLHGDYFGLLYDVLTGKVPEGAPASETQAALAKEPKAVE